MNEVKQQRRTFLKHAFAGAGAAAICVITGKTAADQKHAETAPGEALQQQREILYRETEAFRKHYKSMYT